MTASECRWNPCRNDPQWAIDGYCSEQCRGKAQVLAIERFEALIDGEPLPTPEEIDERFGRSSRWTPERMRERIKELKLELASQQTVEWKVV